MPKIFQEQEEGYMSDDSIKDSADDDNEDPWHQKILQGVFGIACAVALYTVFWLLENPHGELEGIRLPVIIIAIYHYVGKTIPSLLIALGGATLCWEGISDFRNQNRTKADGSAGNPEGDTL